MNADPTLERSGQGSELRRLIICSLARSRVETPHSLGTPHDDTNTMISFQCCSCSRSLISLPSSPPISISHPKFPNSSSLKVTKRSYLFLLLSLPFTPLPAAAESSTGGGFDPVTDFERQASVDVSRRVDKALQLLDMAKDLQAKGDFPQALLFFTQLVRDYKDFALSEYGRVGRALVLYEIGDRDEAITEMEDVSISLKGYPEIHAALAAALYVDKRAPLLAENQFAIATLLDPHYTDLSYVRDTKHWPPSLVSSLQHFITLS